MIESAGNHPEQEDDVVTKSVLSIHSNGGDKLRANDVRQYMMDVENTSLYSTTMPLAYTEIKQE
jgi:hypothetical protein